jgi:translation initiation factor 2 beta subunit (eIF-2beta)/eIF-5
MEEYESLLNSAFEKVKQQECCERFEIRKADWHVQGKKTIINNFMQISFKRTCSSRTN